MITNLVASVVITLVTNVVPSDNAIRERDPFIMWPEGGGPLRVVKEATEVYWTTNIIEHVEITVPLADGPFTFGKDRLLSSVTGTQKRFEEWKPAGVRTNDLTPSTQLWMTNSTIPFRFPK